MPHIPYLHVFTTCHSSFRLTALDSFIPPVGYINRISVLNGLYVCTVHFYIIFTTSGFGGQCLCALVLMLCDTSFRVLTLLICSSGFRRCKSSIPAQYPVLVVSSLNQVTSKGITTLRCRDTKMQCMHFQFKFVASSES